MTYIHETLKNFSNEVLVTLLDKELLNPLADVTARRVLKDRLENYDGFMQAESLADKVVSA
jgi:hypothetical protein